jgi:pyruvate dehydrogenase E1 component beta subunit
LTVAVPSTPYDAKGLLASAVRSDDPVILLEPSRLYRTGRQEIPDEAYEVPLGKARIVSEGTDLTIVAWGAMVPVAEKAAALAAGKGWSAEIVDLRTLSPMDRETIIGSVQKTGRALIVHEAPRTCGLGGDRRTSARKAPEPEGAGQVT